MKPSVASLRLVLRGLLTMHGAYTSASAEWQHRRDAPILRDGHGRILLSGSGLKGQLRALARRVFAGEEVDSLFGTSEFAARLTVADAPAQGSPEVELRPRVGIDRDRGSARDRLLSNFDVAPAQSSFPLELTVRTSEDRLEADRRMLAWLARLLEWGAVMPGANSRRGCGHCRASDLILHEYHLDEDAGLIAWLANGLPEKSGRPPAPETPAGEMAGPGLNRLRLDFELEFADGVLVAAEPYPDSESGLPAYRMRKAADPEQFLYVLPGSGIRGVLRQASERLARLAGQDPCRPELAGGWCRAGREKQAALDGSDLCPVCRLFGAIGWRSPLAISDFVMLDGTGGVPKKIDHVGINRFSGGVHGSAKFDEEPVVGGVFGGSVFLEEPSTESLLAIAHLGLILDEGQLWFGHSTRKGLGRVTGWKVTALSLLQSRPPGNLPDALVEAARSAAPGTPLDRDHPLWKEIAAQLQPESAAS